MRLPLVKPRRFRPSVLQTSAFLQVVRPPRFGENDCLSWKLDKNRGLG